jgi:hypothetical protein
MSYCRQCGKELVADKGRRPREFCNDACKQANYRKRHGSTDELTAAKEHTRALEAEVAHLRYLLDVDRRYYEDTEARAFKAWLRRQPTSAFIEKLLDSPLLPPRGSRALYEAHARRLHSTPEELSEFVNLWKRMLIQQP